MSVIIESTYTPPLFFRNRHVQSIYPVFFRPIKRISYVRERIDTPDGDFLDLDWSPVDSHRLLIAIHGLEGSSHSRYMHGIIGAFNRRGWDGMAMNLRGCSGEINRQVRFYHAGATEDVHCVIDHVIQQQRYTTVALVGFSMGGNMLLKYLGEHGSYLPACISTAAAVSVPCDLASSALKLAHPRNFLYMNRFIYAFRRKIRAKKQAMPGQIDDRGFHTIRTFKQYDDRYTAPLNGFRNAEDYWEKGSSKPHLAHIRVPTLLINALDDPMLAQESFPIEIARQNSYLFLEMPEFGGHVGFIQFTGNGEYWHESRIAEFVFDHSHSSN